MFVLFSLMLVTSLYVFGAVGATFQRLVQLSHGFLSLPVDKRGFLVQYLHAAAPFWTVHGVEMTNSLAVRVMYVTVSALVLLAQRLAS